MEEKIKQVKLEFNPKDGFCTLEQGKKIEELLDKIGAEFDSEMVWVNHTPFNKKEPARFILWDRKGATPPKGMKTKREIVSAYSCAELGFLLPSSIDSATRPVYFYAEKQESEFKFSYRCPDGECLRDYMGNINRCEAQAKADLFIMGVKHDFIHADNIGK